MTFAQRGMYLEMLIEQWDKGSIPDCPKACAELLGGTDQEWVEAWPALRRKFVDRRHKPRKDESVVHSPDDRDPARHIINLRLERCRRDWEIFKKGKSEAGRKGGRANASRIKEITDKQRLSSAEPVLKQKEAHPKPSLLCSAPASAPSPAPASASAPAVDSRSKRPIFRGQRLTVFDWMLDDLSRLLGRHTETFDLHSWFYALDAEVEKAGEMIPQRDGGKWLHDRTLQEAMRRGLPLAASTTNNPKTAGNLAAAARFVARGRA